MLLTLIAASGIAMSAEATFDDLAQTSLAPSPHAALLAPIAEGGRTGWDCTPEKAARATAARAAELPASAR